VYQKRSYKDHGNNTTPTTISPALVVVALSCSGEGGEGSHLAESMWRSEKENTNQCDAYNIGYQP
jgi:hypothetical protein